MIPRLMDTIESIENFIHTVIFSEDWAGQDEIPELERGRNILSDIASLIRGLIGGIFSGY